VDYPAQPYIPPTPGIDAVAAQIITDYNLGWNAGARSRAFIGTHGRMQFSVPYNVIGAVVGMNDEDVDAGYISMEHALYFAGGIQRIFEDGVPVFYGGPFATSDDFVIRRINGVISYYKNDVLQYVSQKPSSGYVFMDTSLYSGGDFIYDPSIIDTMSGSATLRSLYTLGRGMQIIPTSGGDAYLAPLDAVGGISATRIGNGSVSYLAPLDATGRGAQFDASAYAIVVMEPLQGTSRQANRSNASMSPLIALGSDRIYGEIDVSFPPLTVFAQGGMPVPAYAIGSSALLYLTGGATGLTGEIGGSAADMYAIDSLGSEGPYGESIVSMVPLYSVGYGYEGNTEATMISTIGGFLDLAAPLELYVTMNSDMSVATIISLGRTLEAEASSEATFTTTFTLEQLLNAVMNSMLTAGFVASNYNETSDAVVWALNVTNEANTRYEDFNFNSYGLYDGRYYGCKHDGLYLLEGDGPVSAYLDYGNSNFGTNLLKGCPNAYLGMSSAGDMYLRVTTDDGESYSYVARNPTAQMAVQRVDLGKGLRANYLRFELYNDAGCSFELDSSEFLVATLNRRI
jgi:hypothetical protein